MLRLRLLRLMPLLARARPGISDCAEMFTGTIIDAPEITARYVTSDETLPIPEQAPKAFDKLEAAVGPLRSVRCGAAGSTVWCWAMSTGLVLR